MTMYKRLCLALTVLLLLGTLCSCMELGAVDSTDELENYFSDVTLLSPSGKTEKSISRLTDLDAEGSDMHIPTVLDYEEYCYICFETRRDIVVEEFAFYARCGEDGGTLELRFYVTNEIPTKIVSGDGEVYFPDDYGNMPEIDKDTGEYIDRSDEVSEDDAFADRNSFLSYSFGLSDDWRSIHLEFDTPTAVGSGSYIVVKVLNNCTGSAAEGDGGDSDPVSFTLNYPLFYFEEAE